MGRFGLSLTEALRLSFFEFAYYQKAFEIKRQEEVFLLAQGAWLTQSAKARKKNGRSVYRKFTDFYDYEAEFKALFINEAEAVEAVKESIADRNRRLNQRKEKENG